MIDFVDGFCGCNEVTSYLFFLFFFFFPFFLILVWGGGLLWSMSGGGFQLKDFWVHGSGCFLDLACWNGRVGLV